MHRRSQLLSLALALAGCAGGDDAGTSFGVTAPTSAPGITSATSLGSSGEGGTTGDGGGGDATGDPGTGSGPATTTPPGGSSTGVPNPDGYPDGAACNSDGECQSGNCFEILLPVDGLPPGVCSPCDEDADCVSAGTGTACSLDGPTLTAKCTDGGLGSFCQSQAACQPDLFCSVLVPGAEKLLPQACSQCDADADCAAGLRCVPKVDVVQYSGHKYCAGPGSVSNDGLCALTNGDALCLSGHCTILDLAGLLQVGVCGECSTDADCNGKTCTPAKFDSGFLGSTCT